MMLIDKELITGMDMVSDGTYIPANAARENKVETVRRIERSAIHYFEEPDKELSSLPGYVQPIVCHGKNPSSKI